MDTCDGPDPMVGVEAVDVGKESVVGSPTRVAHRVLPALLQKSGSNMMTEYERNAANEVHFDATVDPTRRHLASGNCGIGQRLFPVDPRIVQQYYREQKRAAVDPRIEQQYYGEQKQAAVGANCPVGRDRVQGKKLDVERIAANKPYLDATVDPTRRHLASGNRGVGQRLFRVDPPIEQRPAAVGADCAVGRDRVQEKKSDVGSEYKIPRKGGKPANTMFF